ncbi:hypothetical protein QOT17_005968 [Balamuthia mandrillaris]
MFVGLALGHGYLASPTTRDILQGRQQHEMWAPVGHVDKGCQGCTVSQGATYPSYTCGGLEYDGSSELLALTARQSLDPECLIYLSTGPTDDPATRWYLIDVIWNYGSGIVSGNTVEGSVKIPEFALECEHCALRWEWYAIQQVSAIEYYVQCVDVSISSNNDDQTPAPTIEIPGYQSPDASLYRNEYAPVGQLHRPSNSFRKRLLLHFCELGRKTSYGGRQHGGRCH